MVGNLFWGMQFRRFWNFRGFADTKSSLNPKNSKKLQKPHRHYFDGCFTSFANSTNCDSRCESATNQTRIFNFSSLRGRIADSHEAIQKIAQPNLARFVVQKIGFKDAVVPSADFLLEKDLRGSPPKSEKAAAFWRVGGAGRGVQPFLRKEIGESKKQNSDSIANNAII